MTLSTEIKSLLELRNKKKKELQQYLQLKYPQALTNKFIRNSWSVEDLVKVADFLNGKLIIKVDDREIEITKEHVKSRKSRNDF